MAEIEKHLSFIWIIQINYKKPPRNFWAETGQSQITKKYSTTFNCLGISVKIQWKPEKAKNTYLKVLSLNLDNINAKKCTFKSFKLEFR
ncbi:hypothetical protein AGMMS49936_00470 [Endomicrobiia bacterium]|nr:hypothetical protein AGMMS49936_00470 [Endomicrobiia bacterium]